MLNEKMKDLNGCLANLVYTPHYDRMPTNVSANLIRIFDEQSIQLCTRWFTYYLFSKIVVISSVEQHFVSSADGVNMFEDLTRMF